MHSFTKAIVRLVRIRPGFETTTSLNRAELAKNILEQKSAHPGFNLMTYETYSVLQICKQDQHYWSPELHLTFSDDETNMVVRGKYQPHPNVWTLFTLLYLAAVLTLLAILLIGMTKISLGISTNALFLSLLPAAGIFGLYFASQIGQRLGHEQTEYLHEIMQQAMGNVIPLR